MPGNNGSDYYAEAEPAGAGTGGEFAACLGRAVGADRDDDDRINRYGGQAQLEQNRLDRRRGNLSAYWHSQEIEI